MRAPTVAVAAAAAALALAACPGKEPHGPTPLIPDAEVATAVSPDGAPPSAPQMTLAESGIVPEWLDRDADPCQDYFQYACGGFLATAEIPPDRSSWGAIALVDRETQEYLRGVVEAAAADPHDDPILTQIGDYYAACLDTDAIEAAGTKPLEPLLAEVAAVKNARTAARAVTALHARGVFAFFNVYPTQDFADATQVIAGLDQGGLGLPDRDYYLKDEGTMKEMRALYRAHVGRMLALLGWDKKQVERGVTDVMRIETALAKLALTEVQRRDPHAIYHPIGKNGLEQVARSFAWGDYLTGLGLGTISALTVGDPKYFAGMAKLITKEKPAALRNYLTWMVLHDTAGDLGKAFVDESFTLEQALSGLKELPPRWRRCVEQVDADLGDLLGQSFVAERFSAEAKAAAVELTATVLDTMDHHLDRLPWMDDTTRGPAKEKLAKMAALIGYPDTWRTYGFAISRTDFAANVLASTQHEIARYLAKIGKPVDRFDWQMSAPTVNAYYDPTLNEIALPAGQLQAPFFGLSFHPAVNFGSTGGGTIGHEMTHGFDDQGSQFDGDGNLRDWWSKETKQRFEEATACVVDQFAQYEAVPGIKLNGELTAGENIADIGGVKLGFQAYQAWRALQATPPPAEVEGVTDDQMYFLAYAQSWCGMRTPEAAETRAHTDPHSPYEWRVKGVIIDQPGFAAAYSCAAGTPMNPGNACEVW